MGRHGAPDGTTRTYGGGPFLGVPILRISYLGYILRSPYCGKLPYLGGLVCHACAQLTKHRSVANKFRVYLGHKYVTAREHFLVRPGMASEIPCPLLCLSQPQCGGVLK